MTGWNTRRNFLEGFRNQKNEIHISLGGKVMARILTYEELDKLEEQERTERGFLYEC